MIPRRTVLTRQQREDLVIILGGARHSYHLAGMMAHGKDPEQEKFYRERDRLAGELIALLKVADSVAVEDEDPEEEED